MKYALLLFVSLGTFLNSYAYAREFALISSYHAENHWTQDCIAGLRSGLEADDKLTIFYLDAKRTSSTEHVLASEYAWRKVKEINPALLFVADDVALERLGPYLAQAKFPTVFYGIDNNPRNYFSGNKIPNNVYGILERRLSVSLVRTIRKILPPEKKDVLILFDDSSSAKAIIAMNFEGQEKVILDHGKIDRKSIGYFDTWKKAVTSAHENYDAILLKNWYTIKDRSNDAVIDANAVIEWTSRNSKIPIFTIMKNVVGEGLIEENQIVGAIVLEGASHGYNAAIMAKNILGKKDTVRIKSSRAKNYYFNKKSLNKFGLTLPKSIEDGATFK